MVSMACMEPMMPGSTPITPPSAQLGTSPGGGRLPEEAPVAGSSGRANTETCPSQRKMEPYTFGLPSSTQASLTR